jgi:hypothetical protein
LWENYSYSVSFIFETWTWTFSTIRSKTLLGPGSNVPGRLHERFRPCYVQKSSETVKNVQEWWTVRDVGRFKKKITITFQKRKKHCINIMCIIYTACIFTQYEDCKQNMKIKINLSWYVIKVNVFYWFPSLKKKKIH